MIHSYLIDDATIQVPAMDTLNRRTTTAETAVKCYIVWGEKSVKDQAGQNHLIRAIVYVSADVSVSIGNRVKVGAVSYEVITITRKRSLPGAELLEVAIT